MSVPAVVGTPWLHRLLKSSWSSMRRQRQSSSSSIVTSPKWRLTGGGLTTPSSHFSVIELRETSTVGGTQCRVLQIDSVARPRRASVGEFATSVTILIDSRGG